MRFPRALLKGAGAAVRGSGIGKISGAEGRRLAAPQTLNSSVRSTADTTSTCGLEREKDGKPSELERRGGD